MTSSPPPLHHCQINAVPVADGNSKTTTTASATTPWSSETNWTVSRGSLDSAVTFESFDFPIDSEFTGREPPLLLVPPSSSDFEPCEIRLNFTQKHEIRQIYIRSTARVYEIYYAPDLQSENEYLCTVRCSAASLDDDYYSPTDLKDASSVNLEGPNEMLPKERVAGGNNVGTNEDDWVEIKLPVGRVDEGNNYSPNQTSNNTKNYQNYYEATAEINDSEPCMALTLRLLSLHSKSCVYVDQVYVFADHIDTNDPETNTINAGNSAGTSLMTMLVPTLLGLTKSRSVQLQDSSNSATKPTNKTESEPVNLPDYQDEKLLNQNSVKAESTQFQVPDKVCDSTSNKTESLLEQLVSRVSRIEDICLRFEENMLKPMISIEARLDRVEQQVELLAKNSSYPRNEPNAISTTDMRSCSQLHDESESESEKKPFEDTPPESPHCELKEEVNDVLESEIPKKPVSIDDALAAALDGFSSLTKVKVNDSLAIVPFESPEEEDCLTCNQTPIDATLGSNSNSEASSSSKFTEEEIDGDNSVISPVLEDSRDLTATSCDTSKDDYATDAQIVEQDAIKVTKILSFDKADILKYFPDQCPDAREGINVTESTAEIESSIFDVKFASLENGELKSHLEALLSYTGGEGELITPQLNIEEKPATANNLLVDLDGDDGGEEVQQDIPVGQQETGFTSLI